MNTWAIVTVVTRNYLHFARVLAASVRQIHPQAEVIVCLVDKPSGAWRREDEPFQVVFASELGIPNWERFLFQYAPFELTCALKPFILKHVLDAFGIGKLLYFDGDILVCGRLDGLIGQLDFANVLLTPHLTEPLSLTEPDRWEVDLMDTGIFNGGFVGVSNTPAAHAMLEWWQARTRHWCKWDINHVDQGWLDAVPALFDGVVIERGAHFNVAAWNTATRDFAEDAQDQVLVNGEPLVFFHFASIDPDKPESLSRIARRAYDQEPAMVRQLHSNYLAKLRACGMTQCLADGYRHDQLSDGTKIEETWRELVRTNHLELQRLEDPFSLKAADFRRLVRKKKLGSLQARVRRKLLRLLRMP